VVNPKGLFSASRHRLRAVIDLAPTLIIALSNNVTLVSSMQNFRTAEFLKVHIYS